MKPKGLNNISTIGKVTYALGRRILVVLELYAEATLV
jgi:hypothetical protein